MLKSIVTNQYVLGAALVMVAILGYTWYKDREAKKAASTSPATTA